MNPIAPPQVRVIVAMPKHFKASSEQHIAQYWRAREQIRNQWHRGFTKTCKKQFNKELAIVTDAMKAHPDEMEKAAKDAIEGGRKTWEKLYSGLYVGMAQDIAPMILQQYEGETGKSFAPARKDDLWMKYLMRYIKRAVPPKVDGLLQTSWDGVTSQIAQGVQNSEGMPDIFKRIDSLYGDRFSTTRSMTIARTEVTAASNVATQQTGEYAADRWELDIVKKWITARDASVRDSHQAMENHPEIGLDELFDVNGSSMTCPGDTSNGADMGEVVNCRCDVAQHVRDT